MPTSSTMCGSGLPATPISTTIVLPESEPMPIELDKGFDEPLFGPEGKLNLAKQLRRADAIVRKYGRRARRSASAGSIRTAAKRLASRVRRGRRYKTR